MSETPLHPYGEMARKHWAKWRPNQLSQIPDPAKGTTGFNFGAFTNPEFDKAIEAGRSGNCSQAERKKNYETFNKILNEEQPYMFGFSPNTLLVTPQNLRAIDPGTFSATWNLEKWWFKQ